MHAGPTCRLESDIAFARSKSLGFAVTGLVQHLDDSDQEESAPWPYDILLRLQELVILISISLLVLEIEGVLLGKLNWKPLLYTFYISLPSINVRKTVFRSVLLV
jgi:hypothetical protein